MATDSGITIIIAGEDQSGAVLDAVNKRLAEVEARGQRAGQALREAGEHAVPPMIAASAVIRAADGDINHMMRSVERFLSTLPGFTAFANTVFPVIGAIAFASVIEQGAEKIYQMVSGMQTLTATTNKAFGDLNTQGQLANDELAITNDKLEASIAKLEHKPRNGMKDAIDDARKSADELYIKLQADADKIEQVFAGQGFFKRLLGDQNSASDIKDVYQASAAAQSDVAYKAEQAEQSAKSAEEAKQIRIRSTNETIAQQSKLLDILQGKYKADYEAQQASLAEARARTGPGTSTYDKSHTSADLRVADERQLITFTQNQIRNERESLDKDTLTATNDKLQGMKSVNAELQKEQEWLEKIAKLGIGNITSGSLNVSEASRRTQAGKLDDKSRDEVQDQIGAYQKIQEQDAAEALEKKKQADELAKQQYEVAREIQEARIREAEALRRIADEQAAYDVATGRISAQQRLDVEREAAEKELGVKRDAIEELRALDVAQAPPTQAPQALQRDLDQQKAIERQHNAELLQLDQQAFQARRQAIQPFVQDIFGPLLDGPKKVSDAFRQMAENIERSLARIAEQRITEGIADHLFGGGASGAPGAGGQGGGAASAGGIGGVLSGLLGGLFGRSKGPTAQAGTVPTDTAAKLGAATGAASVTIINQGSQPVAAASATSSKNQAGDMVVSIILKDAGANGPITQALGGAIKMFGS